MAKGYTAEKLPLSVLLFHAAMERDQSLSDFANLLGVGPISLRQFIQGKTQRPRQKTLDLIAGILDLTTDDVRQRMELPTLPGPDFGQWLHAQMEKHHISRAKLTRETKISDGALRNYLSGQTLPDSDQARRLAEVFQLPLIDLASIVIANQVDTDGALLDVGGEATAFVEPIPTDAPVDGVIAVAAPSAAEPATGAGLSTYGEEQLLGLWRRLHPQGRRATLQYIAALLAEG